MAIFDRAIVRLLPAVPRPLVQKLSERYIAGPELKDARETVRRINAEGKLATIDVLGEEITNEDEAAAIVRAYQDVFADIEHCGLDAHLTMAPIHNQWNSVSQLSSHVLGGSGRGTIRQVGTRSG